MPTIEFESLGGGDTEGLPAEGSGEILLFGSGFDTLESGFGYIEIPILQGPVAFDVGDPVANIGEGVIDLLQGYSFAPIRYEPASGDGEILLYGQAYWTPNFGEGVVELFGEGLSSVEGDEAPPPVFLEDALYVAEQLLLGSESQESETAVIRALLAFGVSPATLIDSSQKVVEELMLGVALDAVYLILVEEQLSLLDLPEATPRAYQRVVERLILTGLADSEAEAFTAIVEALTLKALDDAMNRVEVTETLELSGEDSHRYEGVIQQIEALAFSATETDTMTATVIVTESVTLSVTDNPLLEAFNTVRESLGFVLRMNLGNFEYIGWSYGTGNAQLSKYTDFPFNSFAELDGKWLGSTPEGIFEIGGADDDGEDIAVKLRGAMTDLGDMSMKRCGVAYLYYSGSNGLIFRTITTSETGDKVAHAYKLNPQPANAVREGRVKLGQGVHSVLWGWEVENVDGGSLSLDGMEFVPILLQRRMRGKNT